MASSSTPSSSTTTLPKKYEVFLSFSGKDTRRGFTSHLYRALCQQNIKTFRDDDELRRGVEISPALLTAIEESKIAVAIFSKNYASSEWCLSELAEIIERKLIVMPVFYHVNPDDVQKLKGSYDCSFANEAGFANEEVHKWREALIKASNQAGFDFDSSKTRDEDELVRDIVKAVWRELRSKYVPSSSDFEGLIGIHTRIEHVLSLLCLEIEDVRIIGIWGMGGIGKTTTAEAVFKSISYQFDGACIIEKVGKRLEDGGLEQLKRDVLSKVLHEENPKLDSPVRPDIMGLLNQKKVFIVFDDVDTTKIPTISQLITFVGSLINQCGLGSRIIITSRDRQKLRNFNVDDRMIYKVEGFKVDEALELFHKHASPTEDCLALSKEIVYYAGGNPLALEVLGLHFMGKKKHLWKSALKKIRGIVNVGIFDVLKISYDGLEDDAKNLFLDIACFKDFHGYRYLLKEEFLDGLEDSLSVLVDKSLITRHIISGCIEVHDLLQEMGRKIVCGEPPKEPGMRSRLWEQNDVISTLGKNTGTNAVEVIILHLSGPGVIHLSPQVFDNMHKLRFLILKFEKVNLSEGLKCLPDELMILDWYDYPLRTLPSNFNPKKLVELDLSFSNIEQLWEETKHAPKFPKLKWLILSSCKHLTRIPNLSDFPLLVRVCLNYCTSLVDFPSSVQQHNNLTVLALSGTAIEEVPSSIQSLTNLTELKLSRCTRLNRISPSIYKLKSLSTLYLSDCSQLETFPEILETMESLNSLNLSASPFTNMGLKVLPPSIELLNGLQSLTLHGCDNLEMLSSSIYNLTSLETLDLTDCSKLDKLPDNLGNLKSSNCLNVSGSAVGQLPSSITSLENLEYLNFNFCDRLTRFPPLSGLNSLRTLRSNECNLKEIPEDIGCLSSLEVLELCGNMFESLPKSIKHLSKLKFLSLNHCKMLRSIPHLPEGLHYLEAMDCDQLCKVPDASEFVRCINSKSHCDTCYDCHRVDFIFTNCSNLIKAVSNVFEESLRIIMQHTEKGSGKPPNEFGIYLPGDKIPKWFSYKSLASSVNFQVLRNDLVNRKFMGFVICAVFGFDEYDSSLEQLIFCVGCDFKAYYDHIEICNGILLYRTVETDSDIEFSRVDSDHMLLGYCSFYSRNPKKLPASDSGDSDYVDISVKFIFEDSYDCQLKCCAVHPIYAKEPVEVIGATIQEIGETSERRNDRSDENDEEVELDPKRICTQAINTP